MIHHEEMEAAMRASAQEGHADGVSALLALGFCPAAIASETSYILSLYRELAVEYDVAVKAAFTAGLELGFRLGRNHGGGT